MSVRYGSVSVAGRKRSKASQASEGLIVGNEDRVVVDKEHGLVAVIDGHGGSLCADFLAEHSLSTLRESLRDRDMLPTKAGTDAALRSSVVYAGPAIKLSLDEGSDLDDASETKSEAPTDGDDDGSSAGVPDSTAPPATPSPRSSLYDTADFAAVRGAFEAACAALEAEFKEIAERTGDSSGACALLCVVRGTIVYVANVGDCRAVCRGVRSSTLQRLRGRRPTVQLTRDHRVSVPGPERERAQRQGVDVSRGRICNLSPSRTLGDWDVKSLVGPGVVLPEPEVSCFELKGPTLLVLASDGIWDSLPNRRAMQIAEKAVRAARGDLDAAARALADIARKNTGDDVTAAIVAFGL